MNRICTNDEVDPETLPHDLPIRPGTWRNHWPDEADPETLPHESNQH